MVSLASNTSIPPSNFSPCSTPRDLSPMPRPPSRSETMLRRTLERDSNTRRHLRQPPTTNPPCIRRALSTASDDCTLDSADEQNVVDDSWLENPVRRRSRSSSSRPKSPSLSHPIHPKFIRTQTSPSPQKIQTRFRSHTTQTAARAVAIPRSRTPAPNNSANFFTQSPSSICTSSLSNGDGIARARLERTLHRDKAKWAQHEPDHFLGGPFQLSHRGRYDSKESDEVSQLCSLSLSF
jgi:hypothetical protein